ARCSTAPATMNGASTGPRCGGCSTTCNTPRGAHTTTDSTSNNQLKTGPPLARLAMKFHAACATADNSTSTSASSVTCLLWGVLAPSSALDYNAGQVSMRGPARALSLLATLTVPATSACAAT